MFGIDPVVLGLFALAIVTVATLGYALLYNAIQRDKKTSSRMKSMRVDKKTKAKNTAKKVDEKQRRKSREQALKTVDEQRKSGKKATNPDLATRLTQADLSLTVKQFYMYSFGLFVLIFVVIAFVLGKNMIVALGAGFVVAFGLPQWIVNFIRNRRFKAFTIAFPNSVDVIVRGVRSGLPLNDCLRIIANDADEPVRSEFRKVIEATQIGMSVPEACERLYDSIPTSETNFFSIVISIQSQAGGNLSEALGNLSKVLRERRKMSDKIRAVSAEAKASAMIIGSLPFVVAGLVSLTTPGYMDPLFYTTSGHKVLLVCALLMAFGIGVMKKMINFKF